MKLNKDTVEQIEKERCSQLRSGSLRELDTPPSEVSGEVDESPCKFLKCEKKNNPNIR